jgi:Eukaryotic aspartyl protease
MAATTLKIPITNVYGGGDYTAPITVGSQGAVANVILDTGSSTLAVVPRVYNPGADGSAEPTTLAQDVLYGTGGWTGPVVTAAVSMGTGGQSVSADVNIAITDEQETGNFGAADGILGLAFNSLNQAYNLQAYLTQQGISPAVTYPWPFPVNNSSAAVQQFAQFLSRMPQEDLPPYFTALETQGISKNMFAFYTLRSVPSAGTATPATDPLNSGFFILGGGPEQTDLYTGEFIRVNVVNDLWYNTNLLAVQVAGAQQVAAQPLPAQYGGSMISNSIVDSGTNGLVLAPDVYQAVISSLSQVNPAFGNLINQASQQGVANGDLNLDQWPDISFILQGEDGSPVTLACSPQTYWQTDAGAAGQAIFQISNSQMPQSILGLPLMNNYYTVFDRTQDPYGAIGFAPIASAA